MAAAKEKAAKRHALEAKAAVSKLEILKQYKWDVAEICEDGKLAGIKGRPATNVFLSKLFAPTDVIWIGEPDDSGREQHKANFQSRETWDMLHHLYGTAYHYTCASTFNPGCYSRANANVKETKYLIVEGDKVLGYEPTNEKAKEQNKDACGAIFKWLRICCGLRLRAVIDSGNKSLHGWFDYPSATQYEELKVVLPAMGCDRAMFKPTQPARLPGVIRDNGNEQKLLWIS